MGKKKQHSLWTQRLVTGASVAAVLILWACAASVFIRPAAVKGIAVVGLAFPVFVAGVVLMLVLSLIFVPRRAWIPVLGLVGCWGSLRSYCPVNLPQKAPERSLKVVSYNLGGWYNYINGSAEASEESIARYMEGEAPDIVCLQESLPSENACHERLIKEKLPYEAHFDTTCTGELQLAVISRYPIVGKRILAVQGSNQAAAYWLLMAPRDTLVVVNCHLMSTHLTQSERTEFAGIVHSPGTELAGEVPRSIVAKLHHAAVKRAEMAEAVADFVKLYRKGNLILCGDFNDTPVSYARQRIASYLTDAYRAAGNGIGRSFNRYSMFVRIDHMFCSSQWEPVDCYIDTKQTDSDHYPIVGYFRRKKLN